MPVEIILDALRAHGRRARLAEEVDDLRWVLRARYALDAAVQERLSILGRQEIDDLVVAAAFHCFCLEDFGLAVGTLRWPLRCLGFLVLILSMQVDHFDQTLAAEGASAVLENQRRPEIQRLQSFLFSFLIDGPEAVQALHRVEVVSTVVAEKQILHILLSKTNECI